MHSGPFGCLKILGAKRAELVQKFVKRSRIGIFRNERTRSTPMDPMLTFWCIRTIWVHSVQFGCLTKLDAKRAELEQKFVPRSHVEHSQRTHPIHPIVPKTDILVRFVIFGGIRDRLVALRNSVQNGTNKCKSSCHEVVSEFFATNAPDPPHRTLN